MYACEPTELVTVIIPIYNVEKYLSQCIDSVLKQTYTTLEILLIDDGSTDKSTVICDDYMRIDKRIRVIHQKNHGIGAVRNLGVSEAKGIYLFWMDSDDYIANNIIEELYLNLLETDADISICNYTQGSERDYVFKQDKEKKIEVFGSRQGLGRIYQSHHDSFIMVVSWAKLIKKSLYQDLSYPDDKIFEDIYMGHHLIHKCRILVYTEKTLYYYYKWSESILGKTLYIEKLDYLGAFEERILFFEKLGYLELKETARVQYLHSLIWEYSRAKDILKNKPMVRHVKKEYRKYYSFGTRNRHATTETAIYMFSFFLSPWYTDFLGKVKNKMKKRN